MSYSNFERAADKERVRQELRDARAELLKRAEQNAKSREERKKQTILRGDDKWMLPSVSEKIDKIILEDTSSMKKKKKSKKEKKTKKSKKKKRNRSSSSDDSSDEEIKIRKKKRKRKYSTPSESSTDSDTTSEQDEWIEKKMEIETKPKTPLVRDDWLSGVSLMSYSKDKKTDKQDDRKSLDMYNPSTCSRELNPYWKNGGTGVPTFKKPTNDDSDDGINKKSNNSTLKKGNWKKPDIPVRSCSRLEKREPSTSSDSTVEDEIQTKAIETPLSTKPMVADFLTDQQMNELGAKLIKAELLGNNDVARELQEKLDKAREYRNNFKSLNETQPKPKEEVEHILLTKTNSSGLSRPLETKDPWGGRKTTNKRKNKNVETHQDNERVRFFHDDDKYNLKQMFEREKFTSGKDSDIEFAKIISKHKNPNDDLEDIFSDNVRKDISDEQNEERERNDAIREHQEFQKTIENCDRCFDSSKMEKQLIVAVGKHVYLSLPGYEALQPGHCLITTMQHVSCSTDLDENVWNEINDFRKAITRMFQSRSMDVVFFETARYLNRHPHLVIHAISNNNFELLPFYFKKAIQESESEWAVNRQLIDLKKEKKDLRRAIPKGLPYFWVNFGMDSGFAHVIEDQHKFPANFAQEVIGGLLNLDARLWRRPRREPNMIPKVKQFADWWKDFDITK